MATIKLAGKAVTTNGDLPTVGQTAPDFVLTDTDLRDVTLSNYKGMKKLLNIVPSLDTEVCAKSTKVFNSRVKENTNLVVLVVSADLPFAMARFCKTENTNTIKSLSMMRDRNFAKDYGVLIQDGPLKGITARAIVALDENDKVVYTELVSDIVQEPNYDKALTALAELPALA